jgi:hypothetical protein
MEYSIDSLSAIISSIDSLCSIFQPISTQLPHSGLNIANIRSVARFDFFVMAKQPLPAVLDLAFQIRVKIGQ